jgi:hypothetical protein
MASPAEMAERYGPETPVPDWRIGWSDLAVEATIRKWSCGISLTTSATSWCRSLREIMYKIRPQPGRVARDHVALGGFGTIVPDRHTGSGA